MNRILSTVSIVLSLSLFSFAQQVVFFDNLDSYVSGQQLACQNPVDWTTWSNLPCDPVEDAYVSSTYAYSGANSVVIVNPTGNAGNDLVHSFGPYTSGQYEINFRTYIPSGKSGYFNTLSIFAGAASEWGMQAFFNAGGNGTVDAGGQTSATFSYPVGSWFLVQVMVNLNADQAQFWVNGVMVKQWQWTLGALGQGGSLQLNANDFYGYVSTDQMFIDNYTVIDLLGVPVELTSFTASADNNGNVVLKWSTATETNNHMFEIERKADRGEYFTIGYINGAGTTTEPQNYTFTDKTAETGKYIYRLKQIDFDGRYQYSDEVEVDVVGPLTFNLEQNYPNPFNPSTTINYSVPQAGNIVLSVYNTVGEEVAVLANGYSESGRFNVTFDASNLPSGVYLYKLQSANTVQTKKMMLLK
jgi:hypothetical protein